MQSEVINPWTWQNALGFSQAVSVSDGKRVLYCAGQTAIDASGQPQHPGDLRAQVELAFANLDTVLKAAGMSLSQVVRLNYYTTDPDALLANWDCVAGRLQQAGIQPASTLLGVSRLAFGLMVEIEATAVA